MNLVIESAVIVAMLDIEYLLKPGKLRDTHSEGKVNRSSIWVH